jgi:DnaK suppressor protein
MDLEYFKQRLLERQEALMVMTVAAEQGAATVELDQSRVGRLSRMDALQGQAMSQEAQRRRSIELQMIRAVLQRIDTGDFGYCLVCDEAINAARLDIDPAAPLCVMCADEAETGLA